MRAARLLAVAVFLFALPAWATEVLVLNSAAVQVDASADGRRTGFEIQNQGPNPIYCELRGGTPVLTKSRRIASGEAWGVAGARGMGPVYCKAGTADQVTGAATIYTEVW